MYDKILKYVSTIDFLQLMNFDVSKHLRKENTQYKSKVKKFLIFDDISQENLNSNDFTKIATAGRHEKLNVIYIRKKLFYKRPHGREDDLQFTSMNVI